MTDESQPWLKEYLDEIVKRLDRLEKKFDRSEQSRVKQAGFVTGVVVCVLVLFKGLTWLTNAMGTYLRFTGIG